jgi:hypothetical protein
LVYSIHAPTEVAIKEMVEASQRMIRVKSQGEEEGSEGWGINPAIKIHLESEIETLQNASRDADKLERLIKAKERKKEEAAE